jgi:hypothetical protein
VLAFKFTGTDNWNDPATTNEWIRQVMARPDVLKRHYGTSVTLIRRLIKKKSEWVENINNVFKATAIEGLINKELHK